MLKLGVSVLKRVSVFALFKVLRDSADDVVAGMYALRERRQYVGQEDFEMAIAKVLKKNADNNMSVNKLFS